jgi:hypothetical protein
MFQTAWPPPFQPHFYFWVCQNINAFLDRYLLHEFSTSVFASSRSMASFGSFMMFTFQCKAFGQKIKRVFRR